MGVFLLLGVTLMARSEEAAAPAAEPEEAPADCMDCHSDAALSVKRGGKKISLFVDKAVHEKSVHAIFECADCHTGLNADEMPHASPMPKVNCVSCHEDFAKKHAFHPRFALSPLPSGDDVSCIACHGSHDVKKVTKGATALKGAALTDFCGRCHTAEKNEFLASPHGQKLAQAVSQAPDCLKCHGQPVTAGHGEKPSASVKLSQIALCESCHVGNSDVAAKTLLGSPFIASFDHSIHGAALKRGVSEAANCVDCHGSHAMRQPQIAGSRTHKQSLVNVCSKCHKTQAAEYAFSAHSMAMQRGNLDSPICTDCHGEHAILSHSDPASRVFGRNLSKDTCGSCHASNRITSKYGLSGDAFQTFADSYHGLAARGGAENVVTCASCHSAHAIKSSSDRTSLTYRDNLPATCGKCHPGANARFTTGKVHSSPEQKEQSPILYWIATLYVILIVLTIGGMAVHNLADFVRKILRKLAQQKGEIAEEIVPHRLHLRMSVHERLQHGCLALSFMVLVVTGFMLRYPEAWWVVGIRQLSDSAFAFRSFAHRFAGVVMLVAGVWHFAYLFFSPRGRQLFIDLLPRWRDVTDPMKVFRYNIGLASEKPAFGRFSYIEKAEYWALMWGSLIMGATGVILWFENTSMGIFTKLGYDVSRTVHFYEAILATLAILVWHIYFVVFNPDVYPMNLSWLTGRMSEKEMLEEHPLELEEIHKKAPQSDEGGDSGHKADAPGKDQPSLQKPPS